MGLIPVFQGQPRAGSPRWRRADSAKNESETPSPPEPSRNNRRSKSNMQIAGKRRNMTTPQKSSEDCDTQPIAIALEDLLEVVNDESELRIDPFVNLWAKKDREQCKDEVFRFLADGYKAKGAPFGVDSPDRLVAETDYWQLCRRKGRIIGVFCYSTKPERRKTCYGHCPMAMEDKPPRQCLSSGPACTARTDKPS